MVEHHGAGEYSYSSAPELILSWIATQTDRIRLGHSGVLAPFKINHPIRAAERAADARPPSRGRLEFGMAPTRSVESGTPFDVDVETTADQLVEALRMIPPDVDEGALLLELEAAADPGAANLVRSRCRSRIRRFWSTTGSPRRLPARGLSRVAGTRQHAAHHPRRDLDAAARIRGGARRMRDAGRALPQRAPLRLHLRSRRRQREGGDRERRVHNAALWYMARMPEVFHARPTTSGS